MKRAGIWGLISIVLMLGVFIGFPMVVGERITFWVVVSIYILTIPIMLGIVTSRRHGDEAKLTWILSLLLIPVGGVFLYIIYGRGYKKALFLAEAKEKNVLITNEEGRDSLHELNLTNASDALARFAFGTFGRPVYANTKATFLEDGVAFMNKLIEELKSAESFIHMEYFIWHDSEFNDALMDVIIERAKKGVKVRIIVDGLGVMKLSKHVIRQYRDAGVEFHIYSPVRSFASTSMNFRTHRKITVIDGKIGFTGGLNIGNEYIHKTKKFGYWADTAVHVVGEAVRSLNLIFIQDWNNFTKKNLNPTDFLHEESINATGGVQFVEDGPLTIEPQSKDLFLKMVMLARRKIWITTPYLVLPTDLFTALAAAARSGVDVRIITPGLPDKAAVWRVTRSYYKDLINAGVKIYEYGHNGEPKFIHAKMNLVDDEIATVGTCNWDLRSFKLQYENTCINYNNSVVGDVRDYMIDAMKSSQAVTTEYIKNNKICKVRITTGLLRLFAPLM